MNPFFAEISRTNQAHCASMGIDASELYGTPPNAAELKTHQLIAAGVPSDAVVFKPRKLKHMRFYPRSPFQRLGYIAERIAQGCSPLPGESK